MKSIIIAALMFGAALVPSAALGQQATINQTIAGTRLDINATGEVTRIPDVAIVTAGGGARSAAPPAPPQENAPRGERGVAAFRRARGGGGGGPTKKVRLKSPNCLPPKPTPPPGGY